MAKSFILHDETVNTYGFRMLTSGVDLTEFRKNPVMLLNHDDWGLPIGRWENIRVEDGKILADPVFDMKDERARKIAGKVEDNFIRMASVGAWPPEEVSDAEYLKFPGQKGTTVTRWKMREASIVTIGANHNAVAFYDEDGGKINLEDSSQLIKLFDSTFNYNKNFKMNELIRLLNLADGASQSQIDSAVRTVIANNDRLKTENATLTARIDELAKEEKEKRKAEAVALVDAAIKESRIDAKAKDTYIGLFDKDFDAAKAALDAIPKRQSVTGQIAAGNTGNATELADLQKMSWEELDKGEKLPVLYDRYPEVYAEKFKERFGTEIKK